MKIDADVAGFDDLEMLLRDLPDIAQRRVYRTALSFAATPIVKAAKAKAPTDKIRRNIVKKLNKRGSALGELTVSILVRKAFNPRTGVGSRRVAPYGPSDAFFSVWYEFGKTGQPATPFLRPAYDENKALARERFRQKMKERIDAEISKRKIKR